MTAYQDSSLTRNTNCDLTRMTTYQDSSLTGTLPVTWQRWWHTRIVASPGTLPVTWQGWQRTRIVASQEHYLWSSHFQEYVIRCRWMFHSGLSHLPLVCVDFLLFVPSQVYCRPSSTVCVTLDGRGPSPLPPWWRSCPHWSPASLTSWTLHWECWEEMFIKEVRKWDVCYTYLS